ncbi:hypothetical protein D3C72_1684260 [compost metagenome]
MGRRIEVRARVLGAREVVPVPGRAALVVARDFLDTERPCLAELRRQHDGGEFRRQGFGQVHQADAAGNQLGHELGKDGLAHDALSCLFLWGVGHPYMLRRCLTPFEMPWQCAHHLPWVSDTGFLCAVSHTGVTLSQPPAPSSLSSPFGFSASRARNSCATSPT